MVRVNFDCEDFAVARFAEVVGKRNVAKTLRAIIQSYQDGQSLDELTLRKRFLLISERKAQLDAEHTELKLRLQSIDAKRQSQELASLKQQEQMKQIEYDSIKHNMPEIYRRLKEGK